MISTLVLSTFLSLAAAQQTRTITIPNVGGDSDSIAASVVTATSGATTLELHCVESPCGLFPAHTLVYGPSTYNVDMSDPDTDFTATMDCDLASSTAVCRETAGGSEANFPGSSTTSYDDNGSATITITAGADKLAQTGSASSAAASQTSAQSASSSAESASITPAPGSSSAAATVSTSRTGSAAASASTAGAAVNIFMMGGGFVGAAAGVFGGLLL